MDKDITTEEKIKEAARKLFLQKGFAGTRTRDVAEEAGINLALLNYYYRSKEKLFEIVMNESLQQLFLQVQLIFNDHSVALSDKIDLIANTYSDILMENPNLPLFVLGEVQANPEKFREKIGLSKTFLQEVGIFEQLREQMQKAGLEDIDPVHFIINMISLTIFPFAAKPLLKVVNGMEEDQYRQFVEERRQLVPFWIKSMLKL